MEINFSGKRALVTGAAQGIGLAVVRKLVECGANVVALDVQEDKLRELANMIPGVETMAVDLSDWNSTLESLKSMKTVQLVVNNAGVHYKASADEIEEQVVNRILDINVKGVMAVCKHVVGELTSSGQSGSIVNVASVCALRPERLRTAYCASKAAVLQYSRCLALECAHKGIRVNTVSPGLVRTDMVNLDLTNPEVLAVLKRMIPMQEVYTEPQDVANAVVFLLCDKVAGRITGANLPIDGGLLLT